MARDLNKYFTDGQMELNLISQICSLKVHWDTRAHQLEWLEFKIFTDTMVGREVK